MHVLSAQGGSAEILDEKFDVNGSVCWSPDNSSIVAGGYGPSGPGLYRVPVAGGSPALITAGVASSPVWSDDGSAIAYTGPFVGSQVPLLMVTPSGHAVDLPAISVRVGGERYRFVPGRRELIYIAGPVQAKGSFRLLSLETKQSRQLSSFDGLPTRTFDVSADGKQIVLAGGRRTPISR